MSNLVFFYGTLMTGFARRRGIGIDESLEFVGRGTIRAELYDLGIYPAAIPAPDGRVWGEVFAMKDPDRVLSALDGIEGYRPDDIDSSLYIREVVPVTLTDGRAEQTWVYFYNAPLGRAEKIASGDYLVHVKVR